jgi:hypothetical protein
VDRPAFVFEFTFEGEAIAFPDRILFVSETVQCKETNVVSGQFVFGSNIP